jgi:translation initiation factor IF-3
MKNSPRDSKNQYRVNEQIRVPEVRVVGDNVEQGIYPIQEALHMAEDRGLDLVEIAPSAKPPVCRIIDYQKFLYQQKKRQKEQRAKSTKIVVVCSCCGLFVLWFVRVVVCLSCGCKYLKLVSNALKELMH